MLSRTADNLYWLARYVERAEYLARILEVTQRLTTLPLAYVGSSNEWESAVATAGCAHAFSLLYPEATEETVTEFLCFSTANPSSIRNCFEIARTNARAVRTALTAYHWVYRESVKPWLIADLLILKDDMPRSLASCYGNLVQNLDLIARAYGRQGVAQRQARTIRARLENSRMEEIFQTGLHEFISYFIDDNSLLGTAIT